MNKRGFTLIELLVVVLMIGVLTSIALPQYRKAMNRARVAEAMQILPALYESFERWMLANDVRWGEHGSNQLVDAEDKTVSRPTLEALDIEFKEARGIPADGQFITSNFTYGYGGQSNCTGNGKAVIAWPRPSSFSGSLGLNAVQLVYNGRRLCCCDGREGATCQHLNVEECNPA